MPRLACNGGAANNTQPARESDELAPFVVAVYAVKAGGAVIQDHSRRGNGYQIAPSTQAYFGTTIYCLGLKAVSSSQRSAAFVGLARQLEGGGTGFIDATETAATWPPEGARADIGARMASGTRTFKNLD